MMNPYKRVAASEDSPLLAHARRELAAVGLLDGDVMNTAAAVDVLALLKVFSAQGHSGGSAYYVLDLFSKLAKFQPLGPLTGEDSEWVHVSDDEDGALYQNNRAGNVFKLVAEDGTETCYDIDGIVFEEPSGVRYTTIDSRAPVEFPYTPTTKVVKVEEIGEKTASGREYLPEGHYLYFV